MIYNYFKPLDINERFMQINKYEKWGKKGSLFEGKHFENDIREIRNHLDEFSEKLD